MIVSPQFLDAFAPERTAKLQNHDIAAAANEGPCSAALLIQPAQLSMELNCQGQDSTQLFDRAWPWLAIQLTLFQGSQQHSSVPRLS